MTLDEEHRCVTSEVCTFCDSERGCYEGADGKRLGHSCIATALREATTQLLDAWFDDRWRHLHLGDVER